MAIDLPDTMLLRSDPARNMRRYYSMTIQPNLFGGHSLLRRWGRIGSAGQIKIELYDDSEAALDRYAQMLQSKSKRGYNYT